MPSSAEQPARAAARRSFERLRTLAAADLERVDRTLAQRLESPVALIGELAGHLLASGGKRLRAVLTVASARMMGYEGRRHIDLAAAVEFIHTATLLHDDVVDDSALRRGRATANALWGNKAAVLVGDFLFGRSFQLMVGDGRIEVLAILASAAAAIAEGEVRQLAIADDLEAGLDAHLEVIEAKTARLFAAAAEVGAVAAGEDRDVAKERAALCRYGLKLGTAFQLADDALDYAAREAELGKAVGDDFRGGKITLPVALAFARAGEAERAFWRRTLKEGSQREGDLERATTLLAETGALADCMAEARRQGAEASAALAAFPPNPWRAGLEELVDFCVERAF